MKVGDAVLLPERYGFSGLVFGNLVRQMADEPLQATVEAMRLNARGTPEGLVLRTVRGGRVLLTSKQGALNGSQTEPVFIVSQGLLQGQQNGGDGQKLTGRWSGLVNAGPAAETLIESQVRSRSAVDSWENRFSFLEETRDSEGKVLSPGLRPPQIGALFAVLAHRRGVADPATIVMPTGTGKTETMLAILVSERIHRLLVIVPTNALREQISEKFETLGLLKNLGIVGHDAILPVVATLKHAPRSVEEAEHIFKRCNVVVATMNVISQCSQDVQNKISELCSDMFIDEAHHTPARTWNAFRVVFLGRPQNRLVQFTATPFRTDGKHVDGRVIFNYPLSKAQADGYFAPIRLKSVLAWDEASADQAIARAALEQLHADRNSGYEHVVMARTETVPRAEAVLAIYKHLSPESGAIIVHSGMSARDRSEAMRRLTAGEAHVIVCVNMLGEGFDFPRLKIAAIHDAHKSLAITLQFTGRFTRASSRLGDATVVANMASADMDERLRDLYAEDADWNDLLTTLSETATDKHVRRSDILAQFVGPKSPISLQNVFPKMSAVVYRTAGYPWRPDRVDEALGKARVHVGPMLNQRDKALMFVTQEQEAVSWGAVKEVSNTMWHLYLVHWDEERGLLFINSSDNSSLHEQLAKAVCGDDVELLNGDRVFRVLHGVNRLILMNLGLNHTVGRAVRFTMHTGSDIGLVMTEVTVENKIRSNMFGSGYEGNGKVTIGCSRKGRLWSYLIAYDMQDWLDWCHHIGPKLLDDTIRPDDVFKYAMVPEQVAERPHLVPLAVEWDDMLTRKPEHLVTVEIGDQLALLYDVDIFPSDHSESGPLKFRVSFDTNGQTRAAEFEVRFGTDEVRFESTGGPLTHIKVNGKRQLMSEWLNHNPPWFYFANGAVLRHNELFSPRRLGDRVSFPADRIDAWDWTGTDIRMESQREEKRPESIQRRVIAYLLSLSGEDAFDVVFDDDGSGEAADIVAMRLEAQRLVVSLYHCKYSGDTTPGARLDDLYVVCGQVQKSVRWRSDSEALLKHMEYREKQRLARRAPSRFERGDLAVLRRIGNQLKQLDRDFRLYLVQPGLSRQKATAEHLELLGATETYLVETFRLRLGVICSA